MKLNNIFCNVLSLPSHIYNDPSQLVTGLIRQVPQMSGLIRQVPQMSGLIRQVLLHDSPHLQYVP